jgi:hypothetical protein
MMQGNIEFKKNQEPIEDEPLLKIIEGKIFVEGIETIDDELIGIAFKDFAERITWQNKHFNSDYPEPLY